MAYGLAEQYRAAKTEADQKAAPGKKRIASEAADKKRYVAPDGTEYKKVRFEGEIKKWSEKQKAEVEFIDFIAANFSGNTVHVYESYKNAKGQYVYKDSNGKIHAAPNGVYIDSTGDIYLDLNAGNHGEGLVMNTFAHELYHHIERESPQKARKLAEFLVQERGYENVEIAVQRQIDKAKRAGHGVEYLMKENGISRTAAERLLYDRAFSDFVADSLETMFTKGNVVEALQKLKSQDAGLFNMIKSFIDKWVKRIRQFYRSHSTISIEGDMVSHLKKFEQIQQMFAEALVDAGENFSNTEHISEDVSSKVKFSVREITGHSGKNYGIGVYLDSTLLDGLSEDERVDMVKEYVKELGGSVFTAYDNDGGAVDVHIVEWGKKFKNKSGNKVKVNKDLTHYLKNEIKQEAIALVDELIISSTYRGTEPATHKHDWVDNDGKNDWDVWTTYIQDKENTVWEAKLRIANSANGEKILYDIFPIKMVEGARTLAATTTNDMVSQPAPTVKNESSEAMDIAVDADTESVAPALAEYKESHKGAKFSDRDSEGNQLSAEQQEFFRNSQVRDKNGNLLIVYHGTTANFNIFKKGDEGYHFGTKGAARGRVGYGKNVNIKAVYLNITNPIVFGEDLGSWDADYRLTRELYDRGILTMDEAMSVLRTDDGRYKRTTEAANKKLVAVLVEKGFDGIAYQNTFETKKATTSYIAFSSNQAKETTNISPTSNPDIRYSDRDYTYEDLTSKPDMVVTTVGKNIPTNRADVAAEAKRNAAKVGRFDPKTGSVSVHVDDINTDVILSTKGLRHGLRRSQDPLNVPNYVVTVKAGEILKNSIRVNEITPSDDNAGSSYVLMGAAKDANGTYVVRFVVNHYDNSIASMDVLYALNAKKELAATKSPRLTAEPLSVTSSTISIAELLDLVNEYFPDILPEDVLKHYGYDARPEGDLGDDALYSDRDTDSVSNRSLLANAFEGAAQTDMEKQKIQEYRDKIDLMNGQEQKLRKLNQQIKELSFAKGKRDTAKIRALRDEATKTANRISIYDKQLLRLERSKPLQYGFKRAKRCWQETKTPPGARKTRLGGVVI